MLHTQTLYKVGAVGLALLLVFVIYSSLSSPKPQKPTDFRGPRKATNTADDRDSKEFEFALNTSTSYWSLAKSLKDNYCQRTFPILRENLPPIYAYRGDFSVAGTVLNIFAYSKGDFVSKEVFSSGWDLTKTEQIIAELKNYAESKNLNPDQVVFVDIGANIGWFSTVMAYHGFRVISFEPFPSNEFVLRLNQCEHDHEGKKNRWTYFNYGLHDTKTECRITSHNINFGNGITVCGNEPVRKDYVVRHRIQMVPLDDIIYPVIDRLNIGVVKIDVENYEKYVIAGGLKFFGSPKVTRMVIEFFTPSDSVTQERNRYVFNTLTQLGWKLSWDKFGGSTISTIDFPDKGNLDAFCWKD
eukprot:TRINITY_DN3568_c0_g1_i2.p1 TRINITY_DN3568_c0_g1~~TRINITY_DN3568_c0_g1_i2.p1  ORF type:complete len:356 (+),score=40.78 TRINITY_DN3568_c0_g1_i2:81-1148(+)